MFSVHQLPNLWDPKNLFSHLAVWAGVSASLVAVVVWGLGIWQSVKGWADFRKAAIDGVDTFQRNIKNITSERQRAAVWLAIYSVLAVSFSYMEAVIVNALVQVAELDGVNALFSSKVVRQAVVVTLWPPAAIWTVFVAVAGVGLLGIACIAGWTGLRKLITFLGGVTCAVAWVAGVAMAFDAGVGFVALHSQNPPPKPLLVTQVITAVLCLAIGFLLPKIRKANGVAFQADVTRF